MNILTNGRRFPHVDESTERPEGERIEFETGTCHNDADRRRWGRFDAGDEIEIRGATTGHELLIEALDESFRPLPFETIDGPEGGIRLTAPRFGVLYLRFQTKGTEFRFRVIRERTPLEKARPAWMTRLVARLFGRTLPLPEAG